MEAMAEIGRSFGWVRMPTAWEQVQGWAERRRVMREEFEFASQSILTGIASAMSNQIDGAASLAGKAALDRINAAVKAKSAASAVNKFA
jgi:hypothetical protein